MTLITTNTPLKVVSATRNEVTFGRSVYADFKSTAGTDSTVLADAIEKVSLAGGGRVIIEPGTYAFNERIQPHPRVEVWAWPRTVEWVGVADSDNVFGTDPLDDPIEGFSIHGLDFDLQNQTNGTALALHKIFNGRFTSLRFKNGGNGGWFLNAGVWASDTDDYRCDNNVFDDIEGDTHTGTLEMFNFFNQRNLTVGRIRGVNKTAGPVISAWQKVDRAKFGTVTIENMGVFAQGFYINATCRDIEIDNIVGIDAANVLQIGHLSDNHLPESWTDDIVENIRIRGLTATGGANTATTVAVKLGACDGVRIENPTITGYSIGINFNQGNNDRPSAATRWVLTNPRIYDNNPSNDPHNLHPGILFSEIGGAMNGQMIGGHVYTTSGNFQGRAMSFIGSHTWDGVSVHGTELGSDGNDSVHVDPAGTLGSKVRFVDTMNPVKGGTSAYFFDTVAPATLNYTHTQASPATDWVINHDLGYRPTVHIEDTFGTDIEAAITHTDENNLTITFVTAQDGTAYLS